jgi:Tol biopolymer transport system component
MKYLGTALLFLAAAALACSPLAAPPTTVPGALETSAVGTLTAMAPTAPPAPTETPTAPPPTATATPEAAACEAAYADGVNLFCLEPGGAPRTLASVAGTQTIFGPRLSPDGQWVAYAVNVSEGVTELWAAPAAGGEPRLLVNAEKAPNPDPGLINSPYAYQWRGTSRALVFDTRHMPVGGFQGPGEYLTADLWSVEVETGAVSPILPAGSGGVFAVSPDGSFIAIARPQGLDLVNADGTNHRPNLVTFPSIITYSEYAYKPLPYWSADSTFFSVYIPSPDPLGPAPSADLYRVGADGIVQALANVPGNFVFGGVLRPAFSPDGQSFVYSQVLPDAGQQEEVHLMRLAGEVSDQVVDRQVVVTGFGWAPDSQHYAYASLPGGGVATNGTVVGADGSLQAFAPGLTALFALDWLDPATFYFIGQLNNGGIALYRQALGAEAVVIAEGLSQGATLDVR